MMEISYSHVALLDVLGYKDHLERDRAAGKLDFRLAMQNALNVFSNVNQNDFGFTAISDTLIITCPQKDNILLLLKLLKKVQISFLKQKLYTRGALVYAQHFQSGPVTYSPALTLAHLMEQKTAVYPRIVIDKNIIEMFSSTEIKRALCKSKLINECNGIYFLNILDKSNWKRIFDISKAIFERDATRLIGLENPFSKHAWFENYLLTSPFAPENISHYIPQPKLLDE